MKHAAVATALPRRTIAQFAIVTLIWSTTWIVIKSQLGVVPAAWSVAYRFITAAGAMFLFLGLTRRPLTLPREGHLFALALGSAQFVLNFNLVYEAERHVTSGLVAVAFALLLVPNAVLAWLWLGQRVNARFVAGSAIGIAGVLLLFRRELAGAGTSGEVALGLGLTLGAVLAASIGNVMQATALGRRLPPLTMLAWAMLYGAALDAVIAWVLHGPPVWDPRPVYLAGVLMLGLLASALAFAFYYDVIRIMGPARAAYSSVLVPIIAMAISTAVEGYVWSGESVVGALLAIAGLVVALRSKRP